MSAIVSPPAFSSTTLRRPLPSSSMATCIDRPTVSIYAVCGRRRSSSSSITGEISTTSSSSLCNYVEFNEFYLRLAGGDTDEDVDPIWATLLAEAQEDSKAEPSLSRFYYDNILCYSTFESALANYVAGKLSSGKSMPATILSEHILRAMSDDQSIGAAARADLRAACDRDPACGSMVHCFLYFKGFLALQSHRVAHTLWKQRRRSLALYIQSKASEIFAVDIHPGAVIGSGVLLDHATGVVIGETAVIGDDVSILHSVTLGGTGKEGGDRHPKIGDGVLIGAGTHILGNVIVGNGAKIGAGSVVLKPVPPRTTAVGNPARLVGGKENPVKLDEKPGLTMDHSSWSDYVI